MFRTVDYAFVLKKNTRSIVRRFSFARIRRVPFVINRLALIRLAGTAGENVSAVTRVRFCRNTISVFFTYGSRRRRRIVLAIVPVCNKSLFFSFAVIDNGASRSPTLRKSRIYRRVRRKSTRIDYSNASYVARLHAIGSNILQSTALVRSMSRSPGGGTRT